MIILSIAVLNIILYCIDMLRDKVTLESLGCLIIGMGLLILCEIREKK